jgi:hypothetical protein
VDELKNWTLLDAFDYIIFFKGLKSMEINIFLFNFDHLTDFKAPMSNKWLDFMLVNTFAHNVTSNKSMYLLLHVQASRLLKNEASNGRKTMWWGKKILQT